MTKAKGPRFRISFRRRRDGQTNFKKRLAIIKSGKTRMVVRKSNSNVMIQFIDFGPTGDRTLFTVSSVHLAKLHKWPSKRNVWTAYLVGLMAGKSAKKNNVKEFVLDIGMYVPSKGSILFAALKGVVDAGISAKYDPSKVPEDKISNPPDKYKEIFGKVRDEINKG